MTLDTAEYMRLNAQFCTPTHAPTPIVLKKGKHGRMWDVNGNRYIDFLSAVSVASQGHSHPHIVNALKEQAEDLV